MPTHCPGSKMTAKEADAVQAGTLDFFNGKWWVTRGHILQTFSNFIKGFG